MNETLLQHCRRINDSLEPHKCDKKCPHHKAVRSHECDSSCPEAFCLVLMAKARLLGDHVYFKQHSLEDTMQHCLDAELMHRCDHNCYFEHDVKRHKCKSRGKSKCPTPCPIAEAKEKSKPLKTMRRTVIKLDPGEDISIAEIAAVAAEELLEREEEQGYNDWYEGEDEDDTIGFANPV